MNVLQTVVSSLLMAGGLAGAAAEPEVPAAHSHESMAAEAVSGDSLYQLSIKLTTSQGEPLDLDSFRGRPLLVAMFYSRCTSVCPILTMTLQRLDLALTETERANVRVLMVSLDAAHDSPAALAEFAATHHLDGGRWVVARAQSDDVRTLAAALGVRYRALPDGTFNHSTVISLLDRAGVIRARTTALTEVDPEFLGAVRSMAQAETESR